MTSPYTIHEPNTLFTLPQPIDQASGRTRPGPVYGIHGSRKRKRAEVAIGIDGECLNVYDVKTPRLLTTHALPPQTYLTAPPSCALSKTSDSLPAQRFVYAATRNELAGKVSELLCFQEHLAATSSNPPPKSTREISSHPSEVIHIEPIATLSSSEVAKDLHQVLVVHKSGDIAILSADLQLEKGGGRVESQISHPGEYQVEFVVSQTVASAKKTLLARRPDLTARLDHADAVLLLVTSPKSPPSPQDSSKACHVLSIQPSRFGSTSQTAVHALASWPLAANTDDHSLTSKESQLAYHAESAYLYQLRQDNVAVWDLKAPTPRIASRFRIHSSHNCHLLPVSQSTVLVSSTDTCVLYDSVYGAVQASQKVTVPSSVAGSNKKRKRTDQRGNYDYLVPIEFFTAIGAAVCLAGSDLLSISVAVNTKRNMRRRQGRLIDSLGRSRAMISYDDISDEVTYDHVKKTHAALRKALSDQNLEEFDRLFMEFVTKHSPPDGRELALRAMSLIFEWNQGNVAEGQFINDKASSVKLNSTPQRAFEWMAEAGILTSHNISKAIFARNGQGDGNLTSVSERDMIIAIGQADSSLNMLGTLLEHLKLGISGYIESFRVLMESFHVAQSLEQDGYIANGDEQELTNGATEQQLLLEENAAAQELQLATSLLEAEFDGRGAALKTCIERLGTNFSSAELVQALRRQLSHQGIFRLIEILRIELDQAGWTSRRLDYHPSQDATDNQNEAIAVICKLLNCALDAIGTGGWLSRNAINEDEDIDSVISLLRADTTAVLEGVQESTFFSSFLKDFIRFEEASSQSSLPGQRRKWSVNDPPQLFKSMLPLGLKSAQQEASTRVGAGGEIQKRSVRQRALEMSRKIGKYKFETIRL